MTRHLTNREAQQKQNMTRYSTNKKSHQRQDIHDIQPIRSYTKDKTYTIFNQSGGIVKTRHDMIFNQSRVTPKTRLTRYSTNQEAQ